MMSVFMSLSSALSVAKFNRSTFWENEVLCQYQPGTPWAAGGGFQDELDELGPVFLCFDELDRTVSPPAFPHVGSCTLFGEACGRTGSFLAVSPGVLFVTTDFCVSDPSFLVRRQSPRSSFDFAENCSFGMLSRTDESTKKLLKFVCQ